ncbi:hypothetical protein CDEST_10797 [Colletotrichum destructivum]|uniref:Uncharacterized protein n=1 Tax=Colletotrichum destructivum TaxID=34406 RepID=A0AAX4IRF9_9PEZI|nr:hypothetical protein CDEST_10797 [Colletotrichum destructivum]
MPTICTLSLAWKIGLLPIMTPRPLALTSGKRSRRVSQNPMERLYLVTAEAGRGHSPLIQFWFLQGQAVTGWTWHSSQRPRHSTRASLGRHSDGVVFPLSSCLDEVAEPVIFEESDTNIDVDGILVKLSFILGSYRRLAYALDYSITLVHDSSRNPPPS